MRISVYITSYNQKKYLGEAIESVLAQTLPPSQIIIVDDCSTDGSQELVASYTSRYRNLITCIYHSRNRGVTQSRIDALKGVTGEYVTYVDGDDRYLPAKLEKEAKLLEKNPNAQVAFSNSYYVTAEGIRTGVWADDEMPPQGNVFLETFARDFPRRNVFRMELVQYQAWKRVGFHDARLPLYEDFDMRIRLSKYYRLIYCDEPLTEIRIHNTGLSNAAATQHLAALQYIYRKNRPLLADVPASERKEIRRKLGKWWATITKRAVGEALDEGQRLQALKFFGNGVCYDPSGFDWHLAVQVLLSRKTYQQLRRFATRLFE